MRLLILGLFLIFAVNAWATSPLRSAALPMFQNGDRSFLAHSTLGPVCATMRALKDEPACNPAMLGEDQTDTNRFSKYLIPGHAFGANLFFGQDYETLYKNRDLINGGDKVKLAQNLMSEKKPVLFQASTLVWWRAEKMAVSVQPMRWTYYSDVRNQSYPDLAIHGMQEQSVQAQVGGFVDTNWRLGMQLRYLDRKFVYEEFNVFSALPNLEEHFQIKNQRAIFVEPGIAYELNQTEELQAWRPLLSLNMTQSGWLDHAYDEVPVTPILDAGVSVSPPVALGEWEIGVNYRYTTYVSTERKFRLGSLYRLGFAQVQAGIDTDEWSLGVMSTLRGLGVGMMYKRVEIQNFADSKTYDDSTFIEIRCLL